VLASSLDYETTLKSAAALVVPVLADWCAVDLASADGQPRRVAVAHVDPAKVALAEELRRRYPPVEDDARGPAAVLRSGVSELVPDIPDELLAGGAKDPTQLELLRELGLRSYMVVPLVPPTGGRPIGTVTLVAAESGRRFGRDDLELAEELAARFAAAVHNAELYRQARDAVERQQREARQKEALLRIARLLSAELDHGRLIQLLTDEATQLVGAAFGAYFYNVTDPHGGSYMLYALSGAERSSFDHLGMPRATPLFGPTFRGEGTIRIADVLADPRYGKMSEPHHGMPKGHLPVRSYLAAPVKSRTGEVLGGLFFAHPDPDRFTDEHERLLEGVCAHAAVALDNARLFDESKRAQERLAVAMDAGRMGAWEWDVAASRVSWSPALERIHGIPEGSFDGSFEAYQRDMHPEDRERVLGTVRELLASERTEHHLLYRIVRPDGETRWVEANGRVLRGPNGEPVKLIGVCADVTERQRSAEHLARSRQELERALEALRESEHRHAQILDSVQDMVFCKDRNLTVVYANKAACRYYGLSADELRGLTDVPFNERDFTAKYLQDDLRVLETGQVVEDTAEPNRRSDGVVRVFHTVKSPVFDTRGQVVEIVGVARDVTERLAAEQRSRDLERDARVAGQLALRADVAAALAAPRELRMILRGCCEALERHLEVGRATVWVADAPGAALSLQATSGGLSWPDEPAELQASDEVVALLAAGAHAWYQSSAPHEDARLAAWRPPHDARWFAALPLAAAGRLIGVVALASLAPVSEEVLPTLGIVMDAIAQGIERRRAEVALADQAAELRRSNADLQQFAYVASHDLQEPLRMVASYTQLLARRYQGRLDADAETFIGYAVEGVTRMQALINDLLDYSRIGTRGRRLGSVALDEALDEAIANLTVAIEQSGARVTREPLPVVRGDRAQIVQVLQNLVGNALKFRRPDEAPAVHVSAAPEGASAWKIAVRDNGIGIAPEFFDRVFVIFQRLHTRAEYPGNGMGLAITKRIIERHGGRIWVDSQPDRGTTFQFTLAAASAPEAS
jgi:PAS domain S-box-containing protein